MNQTMKIVCPLSKGDDVEQLMDAGADEFYVGIVTKRWEKKYTLIGSSNRRYFRDSSFMDIAELQKTAEKVNCRGKKIYLALNAPYYIEDQYPLLLKDIKEALKIGINHFIIADLGLLLKMQKLNNENKGDRGSQKLHIAMSTVATTFNASTALFYKKLGAERVILPRHLTLQEIKAITQKLNNTMETEVFMLYDFCRNVDGFCTFHHGLEELLGIEHGCLYVNKFQLTDECSKKMKPGLKRIVNGRMEKVAFNTFAGIRYIPEFKKMNITCLKIVGRQLPMPLKLASVKMVKQCLEIEDKNALEELFESTFVTDTTGTCNCYS